MIEQIIVIPPCTCYLIKKEDWTLSDSGIAQAIKALEKLKEIGEPDLILTQPDKKATTTAVMVSEKIGKKFQESEFLSAGKDGKFICQGEAFKNLINFLKNQKDKLKKVLIVVDRNYYDNFEFFLRSNKINITLTILKHNWH